MKALADYLKVCKPPLVPRPVKRKRATPAG